MKKLQVDRGAIKFVLSGANIMCPGLTSPGGSLDEEVGAETPVVWIVHLSFDLCVYIIVLNCTGGAKLLCIA